MRTFTLTADDGRTVEFTATPRTRGGATERAMRSLVPAGEVFYVRHNGSELVMTLNDGSTVTGSVSVAGRGVAQAA